MKIKSAALIVVLLMVWAVSGVLVYNYFEYEAVRKNESWTLLLGAFALAVEWAAIIGWKLWELRLKRTPAK